MSKLKPILFTVGIVVAVVAIIFHVSSLQNIVTGRPQCAA
jgi:hypothetical protein